MRLSGVYRAVVTRVTGGQPYVEVPRMAQGFEYGPLDVIEGLWTAGRRTEVEAGGAGEASFAGHSHGAGVDLGPGDRVLVAFLEGEPDDPVVLGRLV